MGLWRMSRNVELHNSNSSPKQYHSDQIKKRLKYRGHIALMEVYIVLWYNSYKRDHYENLEDVRIKMDLKDIGCVSV
jgi:hypothetical protein